MEDYGNGMEKLSMRSKFGYSMGQAGVNFMAQIGSFYMLYFYTDVFGLAAGAVAVMFLLARVFDAINDPIMGYIADHTQTRWGRYRPYLLFMAIPLGLTRVLLFTVPDFGEVGNLVYAYATYLAGGIAFTAIAIPQFSLLPTMTQDFKERSTVAGMKMVFGMIAVMIVAVAFRPMVAMFADERTGFQMVMILFSVITVGLLWWGFAATEEKIGQQKKEKYPLNAMFKILFSNKPLMMLTLSNLFAIMVKLILIAGSVYYFKYVVKNEMIYPLFTGVLMVSLIIASALTSPIANRVGKARTYICSNVFSIVGCLILYWTSYDNLPIIILCSSLLGIGTGPTFVLALAMAADTVEYGEWKTGIRAEGLTYSMIGFSQKAAVGLAGAVSGGILSLTGYVPNVEQPPEVLAGILWQLTIIPIFCSVLAMFFVFFYTIDEETYTSILNKLDTREKTSVVSQ
ncbi:MAG: MFS transporter [Deltaproteobacteria bacterium]|nr:MFS transporter [Deltaproteobacteria bacterium]